MRVCRMNVVWFGIVVLLLVAESTRAAVTSPYVTTTMDTFAVWYAKGANPAEPLAGLPGPGIVRGLSDPAATFLFQPYTSNNVLFLTKDPDFGASPVTSGTLTFASPAPATSLALAVSTAYTINNTQLDLTIHYSDGAAPFSTTVGGLQDWTAGSGLVVADGWGKAYPFGAGSVNFTDGQNTAGDDPRVFEDIVNQVQANTQVTHPISSIDVTEIPDPNVDTYDATAIAIFGVSSLVGPSPFPGDNPYSAVALTPSSFNQDVVIEAGAVPEPASVGIIGLLGAMLMLRRARRPA